MITFHAPTLAALLMASVLLGANAARLAAGRPDADRALVASGLVALACAWLAALYSATGW
jgi:hypothetical protein